MKLERLSIGRLPGISTRFEIADLDSGLNIVLGPNASGKSSLCRAVRALLYGGATGGPVSLEATFRDGEGVLTVVREGQDVRWTRNGRSVDPPRLPDERMVRCFTVQIEDLLSEGETEGAIRERIGKILAGGYDLEPVRTTEPFRTRPHHGRNEEQALRAAETELAKVRAAHQEVLEKERRLDDLRERKVEAARARERVVGLAIAIELLEARRSVHRIATEISGFPENMKELAGDEAGRLLSLRSNLSNSESELAQFERNAEESRRNLTHSRLEDSDLTETTLVARSRTAESLARAEREREETESALEAAEESLKSAARELGETPPDDMKIDPETVRRVEKGLEAKKDLDADDRVLDKQIGRLRTVDRTAPSLDSLRNARTALSLWLTSPERGKGPLRSLLPWVIALDVIALAAIGAAAWYVNSLFALLAIPVVLVTLLPVLRSPGVDLREQAIRNFFATQVEDPSEWAEEQVRERLVELDGQLADAERARSDSERREELVHERELLRARRDEIADELRGLAETVGFDPNVLDASFVRWMRLVMEYDDARRQVSELRGKREARVDQEAKLRAELSTFLEKHGENLGGGSFGADVLSGRLRHLEERLRQRDRASESLRTTERDVDRARTEIEKTREQIGALLGKAGLRPDDDVELGRRLELRDSWVELNDALRAKRAIAEDHDRRLGDREEFRALVDADDEGSLRDQLDEATTLAEHHEELSNQVKLIENAVERAKSSDTLEDARARKASCEETLRARLEEELFAASAGFLLDDVQQRYLDASRPAVLRRAEEWFGMFTGHAFALESPTDREDGFLARETSTKEKRGLTQLSSGTRMQLLLALRLAFALEAEQGCETLPFFLDEALTVADPERCRAVVECLHRFARDEDRQVFYLTAQPADVLEWTGRGIELNCVRLDKIRRLARVLPDVVTLELPPGENIPTSEGKTAAEYGKLLGVPGIALWDPPEAVHLFHVLRDDLPLLERILDHGIRTEGQLRTLLGSDAAAVVLTDEERKDLGWRCAAVHAFLPVCREGRGRPVDRHVLQAAGVSHRFIDGLTSLVDENDGDARALLEAIDSRNDDRVRGFHAAQREKLERYFTEHEHIDSRPPLTLREVELRLLATAASFMEDGTTTPERVTTLTRGLAVTVLPR